MCVSVNARKTGGGKGLSLACHWQSFRVALNRRYYGGAEGGVCPPKPPGDLRGGASGLVAGRTPCYAHVIYTATAS